MKLQPVPLFGLGNTGKSVTVNAQDRLNLYPEVVPDPENGNTIKLYPTPGMLTFVNLGNNPIRSKWEFGGFLFAVCGPALYRIDADGDETQVGLLLTSEGLVSMSDNGLQLMIVDNPNGYIYTLATEAFLQITDIDFPGAVTVTVLAQRFIVNEPDSGRFYWSSIGSGLLWDALDFASAESNSDNLVRVEADGGQLYLFGVRTTELWGVTTNADAPYAIIGSSAVERGLAARYSLAKYGDGLMFLCRSRMGQVQVCSMTGASIQPVSDTEMDYKINKLTRVDDATAFGYLLGGHAMYQINFPTDDVSYLYDGQSSSWQRVGGDTTRHLADTFAVFGGQSMVGDSASGRVYFLGAEYLTDDGEYIPREFTGRHQAAGGPTQCGKLWIEMEPGVGLQTGQGDDPQLMLLVSRDGGKTFGSEMWESIGRIGVTLARTTWNRLGQAEDWIYKVRCTDPVKTVFSAAWGNFK